MKRPWQTIACMFLLMTAATLAAAAPQRESRLRTVRGTVVDRDENSVVSAVVYLKNTRTLNVKTYISDEAGHYRFSGLDPNVDYELHAEHRDKASATKTVSSFDNRRDIVITLKLDREKRGR